MRQLIVRAGSACPLFAKLAAFALAMAFIFSCSDDSGGGNGNPSLGTVADNLSSSSLGSTSNGNDDGSLKKDKISGFSQKGPFTKGSAITLSELNDRLAQTGRSFEEMITDDKGSFEIKNIELVSPYVMLKANGFYRNEITGKISTGPINLYAIADIREKSNINVNILTHLEYNRVQKLVEGGKSLKDAKKQAQREILAVFNISGDFKDSEDMSIFGTTDGDAALLAISVLLQGNLTEGQFTERLADFNLGFKETGTWNNETAKKTIADWAFNNNNKIELSLIKSNILGWNLSSSVPDFEKYVYNYWNSYYDIGACDAQKAGNIKNGPNGIKIICKNNAWAIATEYDIQFGLCTKEGEIKEVIEVIEFADTTSTKIIKEYYTCKDKSWQKATQSEIEIWLLGACTKEGEIKRPDSDSKGEKYYICKGNAWQVATESDIADLPNSYCSYNPTTQYPVNCWTMPTRDNCESGTLVKSCSNPQKDE